MNPARLNAVIFDLDGTLLDTQPDFSVVLNALLAKHQRPPVDSARLQQTISSGARAMLKLGFDLDDKAPELPALLTTFLDDYETLLSSTRASLYDDTDLLISGLLEHNLPWAIMTNKVRRFSAPLISRFETFATCACLICPDDVNAGKPDPAGILKACEIIGIAPANAVYVGDHPRDMEAARNAGMPGIAVRWGYLPGDPPPELWGASFIADTPLHLLAYLQERHTV